jgi:tetratricopeptide (TPR) repeat protein
VLLVIVIGVVAGVLLSMARRQEQALAAVEQLLVAGDIPAANRELAAYQREYPDDSRVSAVRARILLKAGRPRDAAQMFERHGAASAADLHAWAQCYLMQSQWSHAAPILTRFLQLAPQDSNGLYELMVCKMRMSRLNEALELAEQLVRLPGQEALGHLYLGTIQSDLKNEKQAVAEFAQVLRLDPELRTLTVPVEDFLSQYGGTLVSLGRSDEAIGLLKRSLEKRETPAAAVSLGQAQLQLGDTQQAVANWKLAVKLDPRSHRAREGLADIALREGQAQAALDWLQPLKESPQLEPATTYLFQRIYQRMGDTEQAAIWQARTTELRKQREIEAAVDRLLIEAPSSYWAQVVRAYRLAEAGNWSETQSVLQQLRDTDSPHAFVEQFRNAVRTRGTLPPLKEIPIRLF